MNNPTAASAKPLNQFLRMAVMAGVESAVRIHIERGDDLNARDPNGMTLLMLSAARNKPAICTLLLSAGVDHGLLDPTGRTAYEIAIAAGADATAAILQAVCAPAPCCSDLVVDSELVHSRQPLARLSSTSMDASSGRHHAAEAIIKRNTQTGPAAPEPQPSSIEVDEADDVEFDLSLWEVEEEGTRPAGDLALFLSATAVQASITAHAPIDTSADWDDIDAYLPELALPLARADDTEGRARLRRLLLRALREGSVPGLDVRTQSINEDRSANPDAEAYLTKIINDLGAEIDERFEYSTATESFEVFVDPVETPVEEAALDEVLAVLDRVTSRRHEPLWAYQREIRRVVLLTAEDEVRLGKEMEAALDAALDALAAWPDGIARTLEACTEAMAGVRRLSSISIGGEPEPAPHSIQRQLEGVCADEAEEGPGQDGELAEDSAPAAADAAFAEAFRRLSLLVKRAGSRPASRQDTRCALDGLRLNRRFLLELIDTANGLGACADFRRAMADFRRARDWMTAANLKLAFFHARKYLHCGEPLDDLAQEGNIGLLKAVDRYDWRRGFRFSTYATWWIRQQIRRYIADKVRAIRVPVHLHERVQRMERISRNFEAMVGREPNLDELSERLEMPRQKLAGLQRIPPAPSYIDEVPVDDLIAIEARESYVSRDPADVVDAMQLKQAVDRLISSLSTKDRKEERVLRLRFGIGVDEVLTLDEIGMRFEVTRERIRQIEAKAIRKLQDRSKLEPFARTVLGLELDKPVAPESRESDTANEESDVAQATGPNASVNSPALDLVLSQAIKLGIHVEDERQVSGRIRVELVEALEDRQRKLARRLLDLGFTFLAGKGYSM